MPVDQRFQVLTNVLAARSGGGSTILIIIGLGVVVFLLIGALTKNTSDLAEVASTAISGIFRNLATMLVAVVVLILLVVAVANGATDGSGISTVAPGEQADAPAADPDGP